jgi:hypothetical protein
MSPAVEGREPETPCFTAIARTIALLFRCPPVRAWPGDPRINMQGGDGGKAKAYQVRQAVAAVDLLLARSAVPSSATPTAPPAAHERKRRR